ncbi:MAG: hypothetical protein ACREBS_00630, partial [Nitrososphaerales archaeon]
VKAFTITKDEAMHVVLRERVFELHDALKNGTLPHKEAVANRDYLQCERCAYLDKCNPYLIDSIPRGSSISLFDLDGTVIDAGQRKRIILQELGLSASVRPSDIHDDETKKKYWELFESPKYLEFDVLIEQARERIIEQTKLGRVPVGISSARRDKLLEATRARLASLGVPILHLILREPGNYDTDGKFKARWAIRLASNYDVAEFFDRDAVTRAMILKNLEEYKIKPH